MPKYNAQTRKHRARRRFFPACTGVFLCPIRDELMYRQVDFPLKVTEKWLNRGFVPAKRLFEGEIPE